MPNSTTFGLQGLWVYNETDEAFIPKAESMTIEDAATLVSSKNSLGITTETFTGEHPCSASFSAKSVSLLAASIMTGYVTGDKTAVTDKTAVVHGIKGAWASNSIAVAAKAGVAVGDYLFKVTDSGYAARKLSALDNGVLRDAGVDVTDLDGVTFNKGSLKENDYAIVTIQPATTDRGSFVANPNIPRPIFGVLASSDPREAESTVRSYMVPRCKLEAMPEGITALEVAGGEFSMQVEFDPVIEGYYKRTDTTV